MAVWVALLRGINVGGKNILPMADLRALLKAVGCSDVRTYIQSGNCIFDAETLSPATLTAAIGDGIESAFGFRPDVLVLPLAALIDAIAANPFPKGADNPTTVHLFFLAKPARSADLEGLDAVHTESDHFHLTNYIFYLYAPEGIGRSTLAARAEKLLGVRCTARNLKTVQKIVELAG